MLAIFFAMLGIGIGFFFGLTMSTDQKIGYMEKWWTGLCASILIAINFTTLVFNLKSFFIK